MAQGTQELTRSMRQSIRQLVDDEISFHRTTPRCGVIHNTYAGKPRHLAYALAYMAAVDTHNVLDLDQVRDKRS